MESLGLVAYDVAHLLEFLQTVPEPSIYLHTYGSYLRYQFVPPPYPNDFASWAVHQLRDRELAERLGILDPLFFPTLEDLRKEFSNIISDHLRRRKQVPSVGVGEPFYFFSGELIVVPLPHRAKTIPELLEQLKRVHLSSIYYHTFDAMRRHREKGGSLSIFLRERLQMPQLADQIARIPFHLYTLKALRERLLELITPYV